MRSLMGLKENRTIKVKAVDKSKKYKFAYWAIQEVEISGSCIDSKHINRSLIVNEWVPKLECVNEAAKEFMNEIIRKIPLNDENFFHSSSTVFHKVYDSLSLEKYFEWLKKFRALFKHRAELNSFIISENIDHIVFRTSHEFVNIKNKTEVWHFIIEATCERKLEEHWTVRRMQFRPDYDSFLHLDIIEEAFMEELDCLIKEIENTSQNRATENLYKLEKYGRAIWFDKTELVPNNDNATDLFVKLFEIPPSLKFEKCEKMLKKDRYLTATINCQYCQYCHQDFYYSNDHLKFSKHLELEIFGEMDEYKIGANLIEIQLIDTINIKQSKNANGLDLGEKVEVHQDFAKNVSRLLVGQSSFEYMNWEDDLENLVGYIEKNDFELKICGKSHKENQIEIFKKYLERNRKTTKLSKYDIEVYTKNHGFGINFTIFYTSINSMGFFMTENYTIAAINTLNRCRMKVCPQQVKYWSIKSVEIGGACFFDSLDSRYIDVINPENIQFGNEIDEFIRKFQIPYIGNEGDIDVNLYSKSFKGYIMTNPNMSEVYQFKEFNIYMGHFVKVNKFRHKLNTTRIINEQNRVFFKTSMIFDQFMRQNHSTNDEWIFLIEASKNAEEKWEITKLVMSPSLELLTNNTFLTMYAANHVVRADHYVEFSQEVLANISRNSSDEKVDLNNCKNIIYYTSTEFNQFNQRFIGFLKLADPKTELVHYKNIVHPFTVDAFKYEIIYQIMISGKKKFITVYYFAEYDFKYGYYHDSKFGLVCPADDI